MNIYTAHTTPVRTHRMSQQFMTLLAKQLSRLAATLFLAALLLSTGCASFTNPVGNGVPVRMLPEELLAETKEDFEQVPLTLLRQRRPDEYRLGPRDTLGIYIEGILGGAEVAPPVNIPSSPDLPPSIGYPFPIRDDGTVSLPYVGAIEVAGLTIEDAEQKVVVAYREKDILRVEDKRILVTLLRPRHIQVLVLREDSRQAQVSLQTSSLRGLGTTQTTIGGGRQAEGQILELPAYENDVLNALAKTGGLPGLESNQEVIVQRGFWDTHSDPTCQNRQFPTAADLGSSDPQRRVVRIPLRTKPGEPLRFGPEDVILNNGDILVVRGRDPEFYYTGGILPSSEIPLPNDYDLTVVEALLKSRGPLNNGGINSGNFNGALVGAGVGNPSPSLLTVLRKMPSGGQLAIRVDLNDALRDPRENILIQADDVLLLQETPNEAFTRYFTQVFQLNINGLVFDRGDAAGTASVVVP
ncbi:MAG: polysaccharide biosynthesis/export family protein [Planctomycetota bacterium]